MRNTLVLLTSEVFSSQGGIPRFNRLLLGACERFVQVHGWKLVAVSLNDSRGEHRIEGFARRKAAFSSRILGALGHGSGMLVVGHANLAPFGLAARARGGWTVAAIAHGIEVWSPLHGLRGAGFRAADAAWTVSRYTAEKLVTEQAFDEARISILPCALPSEIADTLLPRTPVDVSEVPCLLSVTRLDQTESYKGIDRTIGAVAELSAQFPTLRYEIVGEGSDRARLERLAQELGVLDRAVFFRGRLSDSELMRSYQRAWAFVLPSTGEGFGIVVLEAWAAGIPVVVARAGASPELVREGENGLLVDPVGTDSVAVALRRMIQFSGAERDALAANGRRLVSERFTPAIFATRADDLLRSLSQAPGRRLPFKRVKAIESRRPETSG